MVQNANDQHLAIHALEIDSVRLVAETAHTGTQSLLGYARHRPVSQPGEAGPQAQQVFARFCSTEDGFAVDANVSQIIPSSGGDA
jgi:hypothetical protein